MVNLTMIDAAEIAVIGILIIVLFIGLFWLSTRINELEKRMNAGPTHEDVRAIRDRMAEMSGQMTGLSERQRASNEMIRTIQDYLLEKKP